MGPAFNRTPSIAVSAMSRICIVLCACTALATAQGITSSIPAPAICSVQLGAQQQTTSQPLGALPPNGNLAANLTAASSAVQATCLWNTSADITQASFFAAHSASCIGSATGQANYTEEVLLTLVAPVPTNVWVRIVPTVHVAGGQLAPILRVDIDDDGVVEASESSAFPVSVPRSIGPSGLSVRCRFGGAVVGDGAVGSELAVEVLPNAGLGVSLAGFGCDGTGVVALSSFAGNLLLAGPVSQPGLLSVLVLGLDVQPIVIGSFGLPCVLWPSLDLLLPVQPFAFETLLIPASAHPFHFWVQSVGWNGVGSSTVSDVVLVNGF